MNSDANQVRLLYNDEELKQRILMMIEGCDTFTGCTFANLCNQIAKMAFTEHKVKKADEDTTIINEELAVEEQARMSCILWELIWEHKIVLLFGHSELHGLSNGEERFVKYSKSTPQSSGGDGTEIPVEFTVNNINYKVLSIEDKTVEVAKSPNATGAIIIPVKVKYNDSIFNVVSVGERAFDRNKKVTSVMLPSTIKHVGYCAFQTLRIPMALPPSLEKVDGHAFTYNGFKDLALPSGLKEIGETAFGYTTVKSKKASIPASVMSVERNPFYGSGIKEINVDANNKSFKSIDGVLFSKSGLKLIAYPRSKTDKTYTIPNGIRTIGHSSFENNKNMTKLVIPATVNQLEDAALWSCPAMKTLEVQSTTPPKVGKKSLNGVSADCVIVVPKGCVIKYKAASGWKDFANRIVDEILTPPSGGDSTEIPAEFTVNNINYKVLSDKDKTVEVAQSPNATGAIVIPVQVMCNGSIFNVVGVGDRAFDSNKKVTSVTLPNTIKQVGYCAFQTLLITMALPSSLEKVEGHAFTYNGFKDLALPSGLKEIGETAFGYTTVKSEKAYLPASVMSLERNPFYGSGIKEINVDANNKSFKSMGGVLFSKDGRKLIAYPKLKTDETYTIPNGVTTIGKESFGNNKNITKLVIAATVNQLEDAALRSCSAMKTLEVRSTTPPKVGKDSLHGVSADCVIFVPKGCSAKYKAAEGWKKFAGRITEL